MYGLLRWYKMISLGCSSSPTQSMSYQTSEDPLSKLHQNQISPDVLFPITPEVTTYDPTSKTIKPCKNKMCEKVTNVWAPDNATISLSDRPILWKMSRRCGAPITKITRWLTFIKSTLISDNFSTKLKHDCKNAQNFVESECIIIN